MRSLARDLKQNFRTTGVHNQNDMKSFQRREGVECVGCGDCRLCGRGKELSEELPSPTIIKLPRYSVQGFMQKLSFLG